MEAIRNPDERILAPVGRSDVGLVGGAGLVGCQVGSLQLEA